MTHADDIAESDIQLEPSQLWMLPILLFQIMAALFTDYAHKLKRLRRRKPPRSRKWQSCYADLCRCEYSIDVILAEGARRLLAGQPLDLESIVIPPPPSDWRPESMPRSAHDMSLRFEATALFHADPEAFIRRHAARILAKAKRDAAPEDAGNDPNPHGEQLGASRASVEPWEANSPASERIRAPP